MNRRQLLTTAVAAPLALVVGKDESTPKPFGFSKMSGLSDPVDLRAEVGLEQIARQYLRTREQGLSAHISDGDARWMIAKIKSCEETIANIGKPA